MDTSPSSSPISTPTLPTAPPAGHLGGLDKMQQEPPADLASIDNLPIEAASNKPSWSGTTSSSRAIATPQSRDSIHQRGEKDIVPVPPIPRTDSVDSYATSFRQRRTDTAWSTLSTLTTASSNTEYTEPSSLDADHDPFDEPMIFDETYASHPRPFGHHSRPATFQSSGLSRISSFADQDNCRSLHYSSSPDNNTTPLPRQLQRLQNRASSPRRGLLRSSTGFNPTSSRPARRESNQLPYRPRPWQTMDSAGRPSIPRDSPELPTPTEPITKIEDEILEGNMLGKIDHVAEDVGSFCIEDMRDEHDAGEELEMHMSDSSDSAGDIDTPSSSGSSSKPDDQLVQDACDHLLKNVFGVDLQELGVTSAASAAYDSVNYCLDELSHIVPAANSMAQSSPPLREVPNHGNTRAGNNTPILPGNGGEYKGYQGGGNGDGNGNGNGNGGGNKRRSDDAGNHEGPNGGGGGNGPGDRENGGGGKRTKVLDQPSEDHKLSCPFRKRNPVKFNVRDYQSCAVQSFPDISQLKRHVKNFHKQKSVSVFACPRCKKDMYNKEGQEKHLKVPNDKICTPEEAPEMQNPEDGITSGIEDVLNGRKANTKVDTWEVLWPTLFPHDTVVLDSHFVPPVELDEVYVQFGNSIQDLESRIRQEEKKAGAMAQSLEERIARIVATCTEHIESVIASSRIQANNAPGRPRRHRSVNGQNPRSTAASPMGLGQKHSSQSLLALPQGTQPQPIPQKRQQQRPSTSESSLSSSFDGANSIDSLSNVDQIKGQQHFDGYDSAAMPMQSLSQYSGLAIGTGHVMNANMDDSQSFNTGPAGSPAHFISPPGHAGPVIASPQAQAHLRNMAENNFQVTSNGGQAQSPVTDLMGSQLHHNKSDSAIAGLDTTSPYFRATYQNNISMNNMSMYNTNQSVFQPIPTPMGGYPTSQVHPQMQMRYRQPAAPVSMPGGAGGTIDPRMIQHNFPHVGPMGMGNSCNNGNGYNAFSPGGGDGAN